MSQKEKIGYLLQDLQTLLETVEKMKDAEIYPVSFFSKSFQLTHKILKDLHSIETEQIDMLRRQMEEHRAILESMPVQSASPQPQIEVNEIIESTEPVEAPIKEEFISEIKLVSEPPMETETEKTFIEEKEYGVVSSHPPISKFENHGVSLNEILERKSLSDFRKAFSLNDRFYFRRELFGGNEEKMNQAIADLNNIQTFEESLLYLNNQLRWNLEDKHVESFIKLLEKRFL